METEFSIVKKGPSIIRILTKGEIFVFIQLEMADQELEVVVAATTRQPY